MPSVRAGLAIAGFSIALASCGVPSPDPALWQTDVSACPTIASAEQAKPDYIFVMSSSLLDCRTGAMRFSTYRSNRGVTFAQAQLTGPEDDPARSHTTRRFADREAWRDAIRKAVSSEGGSSGKLAIYVHGYNNSYEEALRTGEIVRRSFEYSVPTVVLSWPSRDRGLSYIYDEASLGWAQQYNSEVLADLAEIASDITLVSHSMGGRALIQSVLDLDTRYPGRARNVKRLVIASPDVDRHRVLRDGGEIDRLLTFGQPGSLSTERRDIVVYTSAEDRPIWLSQMAHGYARLGTTQCRYSVDYADREVAKSRRKDCHATRFRDNFWIVDTSNSPGPDSDFWRHSDVFESCTGRADLRAFLMGRHDVPWRERLDAESYPDWQATPEWAGRVGWRLVDDPGLQRDGECIEWMPAGERTLSATN